MRQYIDSCNSLPGARRGLICHVLPTRRVVEVVLRYSARARTPAYIHSPSAMSSKVADNICSS